MSDYSETFTKVDGNTIEAADFETEFQAIETAIATKADASSGTLTSPVINTGVSGTANIARLVRDTAVATTSGSSVTFSSIPDWVKKITIIIDNVSGDSACDHELVIGDSGGLERTGYTYYNSLAAAGTQTEWVWGDDALGSSNFYGAIKLYNPDGNDWVMEQNVGKGNASIVVGGGGKTLSDTLTQLQLELSAGTYNSGQVNIIYEG